PVAASVGSDGLLLTASQGNDGVGSLLVQPITSINYEVTARVAVKTTNEQTGASINMVGGANNRFGAPIAGIGIGAFGSEVKAWRVAKDDARVLQTYDRDATQAGGALNMTVCDGQVVGVSWQEGASDWKTAVDAYDAGPLVPWGMGFRVGLAAQGNGGQVRITKFDIKNH